MKKTGCPGPLQDQGSLFLIRGHLFILLYDFLH